MSAYQKMLFVYLDILGFRSLVEFSKTDPAQIDRIRDLLDLLKSKADFNFVNLTTTLNFSDLVVRATRLDSGNPINWINSELIFLSKLQCELAVRHGVLLRGGVTIDGISLDNNLLFGPALVRAYELAENLAIFPRIAIDNAVLAFREHGLIFNACRKQADDGIYFIDYLYGAYQGFLKDDWSGGRFGLLQKHKSFVERKLREFAALGERVKQKAVWLAIYHNDVINRLSADPESHPPNAPGENATKDLRARFNGLLIHPDQFAI